MTCKYPIKEEENGMIVKRNVNVFRNNEAH